MQKMFKKIKNFLIEKPNLGGKWMDLNYISNGMCWIIILELDQSEKNSERQPKNELNVNNCFLGLCLEERRK